MIFLVWLNIGEDFADDAATPLRYDPATLFLVVVRIASCFVRISSPFTVKVAGRLTGAILWSIFRTLRKEMYCRVDPFGFSGEPKLLSLWHDSAVLGAFGGKHEKTVALTSRHRDGTFVENILRAVNVPSIRGSSGKSGGRAARELLRQAETHNIVITPDGPRGPRRKMSRGIVYLASKTGNGIIPTGFACANAWEVKGSWTSLTIPKPFSRVAMLCDEPIYVPANLDEKELSWHVEEVQKSMDRMQEMAVRRLAEPLSTQVPAMQAPSLDKAA